MADDQFNVVSLREYLEARIDAVDESSRARDTAQDKATGAALKERENAIAKVEQATEKRFEAVNEFRETLADQARLLMPRAESEAMHKATRERNDGEFNIVNERLTVISARLAAFDAQGTGKQIGWSSVISVIAVITAVAGLILVLYNLKGASP